ncbi:Zinc finger protein ZAT12 [Hibiscus syriacus]|uniref:Zinc finger protein ZAT12 n=1 Tax=Hibiscus syriacus TaxID=106335 RepID=A0A6A2X5K2_HIBSY|nr:zinc finger protein ZAT12-like [Hibiscus syriacus]KAE8670473.1 Zinc finger protein ZAT12 [Hibiscus syriacus]
MKRGREVAEMEAMDMANCLMLLSKIGQTDASKHYQGGGGGRVFACKTCNKRFSSFQALGGHRASHKKPRLMVEDAPVSPKKPKTHECSICGLEFAIGQALGGHMRRHRAAGNEGLVTRDLLPEMDKWSEDESDLVLDLSLTPWGTDLELKLGKVEATPVVHCFI